LDSGRIYSFLDKSLPENETVYYRIRAVDYDGSYQFSSIISVAAEQHITLTVTPNPATDRITLQISAPASENAIFTLSDITGKPVLTRTISLDESNNLLSLDELAGWPHLERHCPKENSFAVNRKT
jgi:hypothetical protein